MVTPALLSLAITSKRDAASVFESAEVGSSRIRIFAFCSSARASSTIWRLPSDSHPLACAHPSGCAGAAMLQRHAFLREIDAPVPARVSSRPAKMLSARSRFGSTESSWCTIAMPWRVASEEIEA